MTHTRPSSLHRRRQTMRVFVSAADSYVGSNVIKRLQAVGASGDAGDGSTAPAGVEIVGSTAGSDSSGLAQSTKVRSSVHSVDVERKPQGNERPARATPTTASHAAPDALIDTSPCALGLSAILCVDRAYCRSGMWTRRRWRSDARLSL